MNDDKTRATENQERSRRRFLTGLIGAAGGLFTLLAGVPIVGYVLAPLGLTAEKKWVRVASLNEINADEPKLFAVEFPRQDGSQQWNDRRGVFVIRHGEEILAFSNICTHMGCSVRWLPLRQQIICPCHGGIYDRWGELSGGPPAFSLPLYEQRIQGNDLYVANQLNYRKTLPTGGIKNDATQ